ncbi:MAG: hypothetical protein F6K37_38940 [Moorea sp. SIO4E2]|nr:hypothetical protein [Moorena sp. SIO4E2]
MDAIDLGLLATLREWSRFAMLGTSRYAIASRDWAIHPITPQQFWLKTIHLTPNQGKGLQ